MKGIIVVFFLFFAAQPLRAYDPALKQFDIGVSFGMLMPGSFEASWYDDFDPDYTVKETNVPSMLGRAVFSWYFFPFLGASAALSYAQVATKEDINWLDDGLHHVDKDDIFVLNYSAGIIYRYMFGGSFAVKPGIYLGARNSFSHSCEAREFGMALDANVEIQYFIKDNIYAYIDAGFFSQPYGGVEGIAYIRGGPIYYITVGFGI